MSLKTPVQEMMAHRRNAAQKTAPNKTISLSVAKSVSGPCKKVEPFVRTPGPMNTPKQGLIHKKDFKRMHIPKDDYRLGSLTISDNIM